MRSWDTRGSIRTTARFPYWPRFPMSIANSFHCRISSQDRWEDKLMVDDLEEKSEGLDVQHYLGIVRRRHLQFLIPLFVGWALVWGASWVLPPRYMSTTLILVEQPTMPKDYVTPNVNDDLQERMQSITQQILSRTRLLHIIDQFNLYASDHGERSPDDKVALMRKDIGNIDLVRDERNQITAFHVSFSSRDPHLAQRV